MYGVLVLQDAKFYTSVSSDGNVLGTRICLLRYGVKGKGKGTLPEIKKMVMLFLWQQVGGCEKR